MTRTAKRKLKARQRAHEERRHEISTAHLALEHVGAKPIELRQRGGFVVAVAMGYVFELANREQVDRLVLWLQSPGGYHSPPLGLTFAPVPATAPSESCRTTAGPAEQTSNNKNTKQKRTRGKRRTAAAKPTNAGHAFARDAENTGELTRKSTRPPATSLDEALSRFR